MNTCSNCGAEIEAGVRACPDCGQIVHRPSTLSLGAGIGIGIAIAVVAPFPLVLGALMVLDSLWKAPSSPPPWVGYLLLSVVPLCVSVAGVVAGVRTAGRGAPGLAAAILIPAIILLIPAAICTVGLGSGFLSSLYSHR